ncbi:SulP family inorganic anion transporter [Mongoliitalea daihaiensis]|uniref:SulP family inorganic anion transporter n=1 Tax=Mongoliitalea daihaiensis TaxID=2782006 RepID=UPI001EEA6FC6|nr:SulP family inorganic anion transporter [Mongoliitalea daihaiensis]UJP63663.1 SulP family inorganic anion transporter [Mongoliitalea daihaiensis]
MNRGKDLFANLHKDLPAGLVVFLVALPLCLGIALASGAPLFAGIISGIIGGIVVGIVSGSHTSVSGPAAGLTVIVFSAIGELGSFESFLAAVVLAGCIQLVFAASKAGVIGYFFPTSVIKGMLAGIGIILIIKQSPYLLGFGELSQLTDLNPFEIFGAAPTQVKTGAFIIGVVSISILRIWDSKSVNKFILKKLIPAPLLVVVAGILLNEGFKAFWPVFYLENPLRVTLPHAESWNEFIALFHTPNFSGIFSRQLWVVAITIAVIGSLETLLSVEAADKIDPHKRISPPNQELFAQGIGNIINGFIGGLPLTAVIVRSSANISAGASSKLAAIIHGFLLLLSFILIPGILNLIPLASLAAILVMVGYKLARVSLFKTQAKLGWNQFLPFLITVFGVVFLDLLFGIALGIGVSIIYILLANLRNSHFMEERMEENGKTLYITLSEEVSFLNKGALIKALNAIPEDRKVIIDGSHSKVIDYDVLEVIENFKVAASTKNIEVETIHIEQVKISDLH